MEDNKNELIDIKKAERNMKLEQLKELKQILDSTITTDVDGQYQHLYLELQEILDNS